MKSIFILLFSFALLFAVGCSNQQPTADPPSDKVEFVQVIEVQQAAATVDLNAPVYLTQDKTLAAEEDSGITEKGFLDIILENWGLVLVALMAFVKVLVNLTPTTKDNQIFGWIDTIFNAIVPNYKKGGGTFSTVQKE